MSVDNVGGESSCGGGWVFFWHLILGKLNFAPSRVIRRSSRIVCVRIIFGSDSVLFCDIQLIFQLVFLLLLLLFSFSSGRCDEKDGDGNLVKFTCFLCGFTENCRYGLVEVSGRTLVFDLSFISASFNVQQLILFYSKLLKLLNRFC